MDHGAGNLIKKARNHEVLVLVKIKERKVMGWRGIPFLILLAISCSYTSAENLIKNGDFSHGFEGWNMYKWTTSTTFMIQEEELQGRKAVIEKGGYSPEIPACKVILAEDSPLEWAGFSTLVEVQPGTTYHFSCWIQGEDIHAGRGVGVNIIELDDKNKPLNNTPVSASLFGSFPWQKIEKIFTTNLQTRKLMVSQSIMMRGTVRYADFNLTPLDKNLPLDKKEAISPVVKTNKNFNFSCTDTRDFVVNYSFDDENAGKTSFINYGEWDLSDYIGVEFTYKGDGSNNVFEIGVKDIEQNSYIIGFENLRNKEKKTVIWRIDFRRFYDTQTREFFLVIENKDAQKKSGIIEFSDIKFIKKGTVAVPDMEKLNTLRNSLKNTLPVKRTENVLPNLSSIYCRPVVPEEYPSFKDEKIKPVTRAEVGYDFHGLTQSNPDQLDAYYKFHNFGDTIKPYYWYVTNPNWKETVQDLLRRGLYIAGIWGYTPKNDPAGTHFVIDEERHKWLMDTCGKYFIGYEDGEQDNRLFPKLRGNRQESYEQFKKLSMEIQADLQRYTVTLATLPTIHYYGEFGSRLLGFEFSQSLPSDIMRFSFLRGASKQYGRLTQSVISLFNNSGFKTYNKKDFYRGGPETGPSLSILKRLFYLSYIYGCSFGGFETSQLTGEWKDGIPELSPLGEINIQALEIFKNHPERGITYAPIGLIIDFYHGWQPPFDKGSFITWGHLPYEKGDFQIYNMFEFIYPGYHNAPNTIDERGVLTPTPFGDLFEVLLNNAPEFVLNIYNSLVICGDTEIKGDFEKKLKQYVRKGGQVIVFYPQIKFADPEFLGFKINGEGKEAFLSATLYDKNVFVEPSGYTYVPVSPTTAEVLAVNENLEPLITVNQLGEGKVICVMAEFGMSNNLKYKYPSLSYAEPKYELLNGIKHFLSEYFRNHNIVEIDGDNIQYTVNLFPGKKDVIVVTLVNNDRFNEWSGTVRFKNSKIIESYEWLTGEKVMIGKEGALKVNIPQGDIRIFTIKTDKR